MGRRTSSRALRELGRTQSPERAHALLCELGHWNAAVNPYPQRLEVDTRAPQAALPDLSEETRRDLTHLGAFAIDDEGSKDPDDALSWHDNRLWVHVADVAALVPPDSDADLEARARGCNLYLPEDTVPMLPPEATHALGLGLQAVSPRAIVRPGGECRRRHREERDGAELGAGHAVDVRRGGSPP